jgi:hypothetical protein
LAEAFGIYNSRGSADMPTDTLPTIENWYEDTASGRTFRVVAIDEDNDAIDVQYFDGDLAEFDFSSWRESALVPIEPPEDAAAPFDDLEPDDLGYSDSDLHGPSDITLDDLLDERDAF